MKRLHFLAITGGAVAAPLLPVPVKSVGVPERVSASATIIRPLTGRPPVSPIDYERAINWIAASMEEVLRPYVDNAPDVAAFLARGGATGVEVKLTGGSTMNLRAFRDESFFRSVAKMFVENTGVRTDSSPSDFTDGFDQ